VHDHQLINYYPDKVEFKYDSIEPGTRVLSLLNVSMFGLRQYRKDKQKEPGGVKTGDLVLTKIQKGTDFEYKFKVVTCAGN
jgi:hypothetical protein